MEQYNLMKELNDNFDPDNFTKFYKSTLNRPGVFTAIRFHDGVPSFSGNIRGCNFHFTKEEMEAIEAKKFDDDIFFVLIKKLSEKVGQNISFAEGQEVFSHIETFLKDINRTITKEEVLENHLSLKSAVEFKECS